MNGQEFKAKNDFFRFFLSMLLLFTLYMAFAILFVTIWELLDSDIPQAVTIICIFLSVYTFFVMSGVFYKDKLIFIFKYIKPKLLMQKRRIWHRYEIFPLLFLIFFTDVYEIIGVGGMYAVVICMLFLSGSKINKSIRYMFDVISFFVFMLSFIVFTLLMKGDQFEFFLGVLLLLWNWFLFGRNKRRWP